MRRKICRTLTGAAVALGLLAWPVAEFAAAANDYPTRTVNVVVPMVPGGPTDILARIIARYMQNKLGGTVIVENKPGAAGTIGSAYVARSKGDGYTFLSVSDTIGINSILYRNRGQSYDLLHDFAPVTDLITTPVAVFVRSDSPIKSFQQLVEASKKDPAGYNYGSPGVGTPPYLAMEMLKRQSGLKATHVAYPGTTPMLQAVLGGTLQLGGVGISGVDEYFKSGQLRPLLVMDSKRWHDLPDVPTVRDLGIDVPETLWRANQSFYAPAGTPQPIVDEVYKLVQESMADPTVRATLEGSGSIIITDGPDALAKRIKRDMAVWEKVIHDLNIKME